MRQSAANTKPRNDNETFESLPIVKKQAGIYDRGVILEEGICIVDDYAHITHVKRIGDRTSDLHAQSRFTLNSSTIHFY